MKLQESAVLVMPFFWDSFDYEPAEQPVPPFLAPEEDDAPYVGGAVEEARRDNYPNWDND